MGDRASFGGLICRGCAAAHPLKLLVVGHNSCFKVKIFFVVIALAIHIEKSRFAITTNCHCIFTTTKLFIITAWSKMKQLELNLWGEKRKENHKERETTHQAKSYTGLYALHKYWGKKPYNVMSDLIQEYTNPKDIVLDPFLGSGVSVTEAIFNDRKGFGIDLNPSAIFISEQIIAPVNLDEFLDEFKSIETDVKDQINSFYEVKRNGNKYVGQNFLWEGDVLKEIRYKNGTVKRQSILPEESDCDLVNSFDRQKIPLFYPTDNFFQNSRINAKSDRKIYELFTPRNLYSISILYDRMKQIESEPLRNLFLLGFTSSIGQASKMVFAIERRNKTKQKRKEVGSWVIGYWMPKIFFENNAWTCFETRIKKIVKAKREQNKFPKHYRKATSFEDLQKVGDYFLANEPSQTFLKEIADNSIDYILTDPPHGNRIPYLELSMLWNSWLQKEVNYKDEIVVSEAKERNKDIVQYNYLMKETLKQCYRVLKPEKHISFMFNSLDDKAWISILSSFQEIGFELKKIETLNYSANSVVQDNRKNGLQTDFIITYQKTANSHFSQDKLEIIDLEKDDEIQRTVRELKAKKLKPFQITNRVVSDLLTRKKLIKISQLIKLIDNA